MEENRTEMMETTENTMTEDPGTYDLTEYIPEQKESKLGKVAKTGGVVVGVGALLYGGYKLMERHFEKKFRKKLNQEEPEDQYEDEDIYDDVEFDEVGGDENGQEGNNEK